MPANLERIVPRGKDPEILAIAVCKLDGSPHAGIVYFGPDDPDKRNILRLLHFADHKDLRNDEFARWGRQYICVLPTPVKAEQIALAGYCRRISKTNKGRKTIPYNLRYDEGAGFDPDTDEVILSKDGTGMSCATFVLHVFRSAGPRLIDATGWPTGRPGESERLTQIASFLRRNPDPDHQRQADIIERTDRGCARISPQEVAGACLEGDDTRPALFGHCEPNGRLIDALLDSWCPC